MVSSMLGSMLYSKLYHISQKMYDSDTYTVIEDLIV
jgi:hypothetical protein